MKWEELKAREKDALIEKEFFGHNVEWLVGRERTRECVPLEHHIGEPYTWDGKSVPYYTYLQEHALRVEDEIEKRGLMDIYVDILDDTVGVLSLVRAIPEQRCHAALKAAGVGV